MMRLSGSCGSCFDYLEVSGQIILACSAELAMLRFRRINALSGKDRKSMERLAVLLDGILEAERSLFSATDESVANLRILTEILNPEAAFLGVLGLINTKDTRSRVERLRVTAQCVIEDSMPETEDCDFLQKFLRDYRSYQDQRLDDRCF